MWWRAEFVAEGAYSKFSTAAEMNSAQHKLRACQRYGPGGLSPSQVVGETLPPDNTTVVANREIRFIALKAADGGAKERTVTASVPVAAVIACSEGRKS